MEYFGEIIQRDNIMKQVQLQTLKDKLEYMKMKETEGVSKYITGITHGEPA